ncbi:MAG: DUF411 domain-containing protein [Gemmatimonadaceae bacterium]
MTTSPIYLVRLLSSPRLARAALGTSLLVAACSSGRADDTASRADTSARTSFASTTPAIVSVTSAVTTPVRVFKDPSCGCCTAWVQHMRDNGFNVTTVDEPSQSTMDSIKRAHGVAPSNASCHTAEAGRYVIEGHVPADIVQRLLKEKPPNVVGLAVPGMVTGSPGMDGPDPEHYTVIAMMRDGSTRPYAQR